MLAAVCTDLELPVRGSVHKGDHVRQCLGGGEGADALGARRARCRSGVVDHRPDKIDRALGLLPEGAAAGISGLDCDLDGYTQVLEADRRRRWKDRGRRKNRGQ